MERIGRNQQIGEEAVVENSDYAFLTFVQFIQEAEIEEKKCREYIDIGWLQPVNDDLFSPNDIFKVRKADRLCRDFDLPSHAGAMIVDLLEKIDDLESQLEQLRSNM